MSGEPDGGWDLQRGGIGADIEGSGCATSLSRAGLLKLYVLNHKKS